MKILIVLLLVVIISVCGANEYTELESRLKSIETEISKIEEAKNSSGGKAFWIWLTTSEKAKEERDQKLSYLRNEQKEVKRRKNEIERSTRVLITKIELRNLPDFDKYKPRRGHADLRIFFRNQGIENAFVSKDKCGIDVFFSCDKVRMPTDDVIEIKDEDRDLSYKKIWEDMGQISCKEIFEQAIRNDLSSGVFEKEIRTIVKNKDGDYMTYTCRIHYVKE